MRLPLFLLVGSAVLALLAACGSTGGGGEATGTGGATGAGGDPACMAFPPPASYFNSCGTSGQVGAGGSPSKCGRCREDQGGHRYTSACVGKDCTCGYTQGKGKPDLGCSCKMTEACVDASPTCCPQFN